MKDRVSQYPGRIKITPENGQPAFYARIEMADQPSVAGTPLNKANLLSSATAMKLGMNDDEATVDGALRQLADGTSREFTAYLPSNGWGGSSFQGFTQTVSCFGMTSSVRPLPPTIVPTGNRLSDINAREALGMIGRVETLDNGYVRVTCYEEKPSVNFTIHLTEV